jgi:hypothetical protein
MQNAKYFGAFQVVDRSIRREDHEKQASGADSGDDGLETESYIDFGFGPNTTSFAEVHRFSVLRQSQSDDAKDKKDTDTERLCVRYAHMMCNPTVNKPLKPDCLMTFHKVYAMLLFREGFPEVLRG